MAVNCGYYWKSWSAGQGKPSNAVRGGRDIDGSIIYVGRANYKGDLLPAKAIPDKRVVYVPYGGKEITLSSCELLCQKSFAWVKAYGGIVPNGAIPIGRTSTGETLYSSRVYHGGSECVGKLHPSHKVCYIPYGGKEHSYSNYEVLALIDG